MHLRFYIIAPMKVLYAELYIILLLEVVGSSEVNLSDTLQMQISTAWILSEQLQDRHSYCTNFIS